MKKRILITLLTFLLASCTKNNYNETNESENKTEGCVHKCPNCGLCYDKNCDNSNKCDCLSKNIFLSSVRYVSNDYDGGEKITFNPKENSYTYFEFEKENGVEYLHYIDTYYYEGDYLTKKLIFTTIMKENITEKMLFCH